MLRIDLFTEISCPWCIVGLHRLDKVLAERFHDLPVDIRHHPVLLLANVPSEGFFIPDLLRSRYGITDPKAAFARPEAEARASGLDLDLGRQLRSYPTQAAHGLVMAAREQGTQHALAVAITDAYFLEAQNIADADVLADLGSRHGFEPEEARRIALDPAQHGRVEEASARAGAQGVRSVPHIVFDGRINMNGGRSEDELAHGISAALR
ncbi:MAG: DsbA family protein [Mesorhizobium sp.]|uniref:DsbA family oxidoreductase n=1 Tax=Mesorhizobium sp. TaxID=1871066 RepID=UPI001207AAA7|nr:DsbA family protein [Mesorhizobium sp.]TIP02991.1 MAG: DsbA family protein [Mesorhizobium sp.]TIP40404.1 MAG: DsbA family protein [Mesorhizobium sp.]TJV74031.1 MAG: DsbA family protein [Mesorhizobium sp.]